MGSLQDQDQQVALELSRKINANPRRRTSATAEMRSIVRQTTMREARASKRAQRTNPASPGTPLLLPLTPPHLVNMDSDSSSSLSSLSSPMVSEPPSPVNVPSKGVVQLKFTGLGSILTSKPIKRKNEGRSMLTNPTNISVVEAPKERAAKTIFGITNVTIDEADERSQPPPGEDLVHLVEVAKAKGELPKLYDSAVVRRIDGKWMAPQMCKSCSLALRGRCDRKSPCISCTSIHATCETDGYMTILRATRNASRTIVTVNEAASSRVVPITSDYVGQNADGSWFCESPASLQVVYRQRNCKDQTTSKRNSATQDIITYINQDEHSELDMKLQEPKIWPSKKRKVEDSDFVPVDRQSSTVNHEHLNVSPHENPAPKRRARASKGPLKEKYHLNVQQDKPEPFGQPPAWADKRQQLCEALPYYRAYQSGAYMHDGVVRGFMCDKEVGPRDIFDDQIMIARVGGGRVADDTGRMVQTRDQDKSTFALGFSRSMQLKSPIAIIAGQSNRISPSKLPHYYNILDWFHVTDVWCEKSNGFKCWMVRLEKINLSEKSWWSAKCPPAPRSSQSVEASNDGLNFEKFKVASRTCTVCNRPSKSIYNEGWACLNSQCRAFFDFNKEYDDKTLDFNLEFLRERTPFLGSPPDSLVPPLLTDEDLISMEASGIEKECKRGIVCPKCRCCSRRIEWRQWSCENITCDFTHRINQHPLPISDVVAQSIDLSLEDRKDLMTGGIRLGQMHLGRYDVFEYILPGEDGEDIGFVRHFKADGIINQQRDGPNDLFLHMQESDLGLKRSAARQKGLSGEILTSHWAANWGAPYKYGVSQISKGFDAAPLVILKALKRLTWAGEQVVTDNFEPFHPFNELLSIGYFEDTSIGYHDDGEKELGPTVATLSLGASATMSFRPKARSALSLASGRVNCKGTKPDVLRFTLDHGDLVVMHGRKIQQLYEHAVKPRGKLRFALTCRYVRPEMMADDKERQYAQVNGALPPGSEEYNYDGDLNATSVALVHHSLGPINEFINNVKAKIHVGDIGTSQARQVRKMLADFVAAIPEEETVHHDDVLMLDVA